MDLIFDFINNEPDQIMLKRITDPRFAVSIDDIVLEGIFSESTIQSFARSLPPPLSVIVENKYLEKSRFEPHAAIEWDHKGMNMFSGVTILPLNQVTSMIDVNSPKLFINLINSTPAGSYLKSLLLIKPKGIVKLGSTHIQFVLPVRRPDFLLKWVDRLANEEPIDFDWLSGSTGELSDEIVNQIGSIDQARVAELRNWLSTALTSLQTNPNKAYHRAIRAVV